MLDLKLPDPKAPVMSPNVAAIIVAASISLVVGVQAPTALMCAPGSIQLLFRIAVGELVAVTIKSAPLKAAVTLSLASKGKE